MEKRSTATSPISSDLTTGEGNLGMYTAYLQNIPEARYTSVIVLHRRIVEPLYGGKSRTCLIRTDPAQGAPGCWIMCASW